MAKVNGADLTSNFAPRWTSYLCCSTSLEWGKKLLTSVFFLGGFYCGRLLCQPSPVDFRLFLPRSSSLAPHLNPSLPRPRICSAFFPLLWGACAAILHYTCAHWPSPHYRLNDCSSWLPESQPPLLIFISVLLSGNLTKWGGRKREWEREEAEKDNKQVRGLQYIKIFCLF